MLGQVRYELGKAGQTKPKQGKARQSKARQSRAEQKVSVDRESDCKQEWPKSQREANSGLKVTAQVLNGRSEVVPSCDEPVDPLQGLEWRA